MHNKQRIFLAGATGEIGKRVLRNLIDDPEVQEIHLLLRRTLSAPNPRIYEHLVNFDDLAAIKIDNPENLESLSICTLGSTIKKAGSEEAFQKVDLEYACNFAEFSLNQRCGRFAVISSVGANKNSKSFYLKIKGSMEDRVSKMPFKSTWIFRPSLLIGKRAEFRLGEKLGAFVFKLLAPFFAGPLKKYRPIKMDLIAQALSKITTQDTGDNQFGVQILGGCEIKALTKK